MIALKTMGSKTAPTASVDTTGRFSVVHLLDQWYVACRSADLRTRPVAVTIHDTPLVLFRAGDGAAAALLDRCAHRNVPLSYGRVVSSQIECPYHGWRFDADGACRLVPALCGPQQGKARRVPRFAVREQQGLVWVYMTPDIEPQIEPTTMPGIGEPKYIDIEYSRDFEGTLHATVENVLDVPHTAFLHGGIFRTTKRHRIEVIVRRGADRVEAEFIGEPAPGGIMGRLLAPRGGTIEHFDRFILPSLAQVEYRLGRRHLLINTLLTPISDFNTRMFTTVSVRFPVGGKIIQRLVMPLALKVASQDASILKLQSETTRRFGGEKFVSTPVDLLGPHILRLMKQAERGDKPSTDDEGRDLIVEERLEMMA